MTTSTFKFAVPGIERQVATSPLQGIPQLRSVDVGLARDGAGQEVLVEADSERHVVALSFGGGPTLFVNPRDVASLVSASGSTGSSRGSALAEPPSGVVLVGTTLPGMASRGVMSQVLTGFGLFDFSSPNVAAELATPLVAAMIEQQVKPGVWKLRADDLPVPDKLTQPMALQTAPKEPLLIFIHGTASSTSGGYQGLWLKENADLRAELFKRYPDRVYALDHKTLTESPIDNALALVQALPPQARLHLVTHSRGGLVADLLSRSQTWKEDADGKLTAMATPFDAADLELFADAQYAGLQDELRQLGVLLAQKQVVVERIVRVASPSRGTVLASERLDLYLSTLSWLLARGAEAAASAGLVPVAGVVWAAQALAKLAAAIAHNRTDAKKLPGIEAMMPDRKLVAMLNRRDLRVSGDLRVIAGDIEPGDGFFSWLKVKLVDAFYWEDHDLVVNTSSMDKGPRRLSGKAYQLLAKGAAVDHFSYFSTPHTAQKMASALEEPVPAEFLPVASALAVPGKVPSRGGPAAGTPSAAGSRPTGEMPAVVVVHGIMGSHLKAGDMRVWFELRRILGGSFTQLAYDPKNGNKIAVDGMLGRYYEPLMNVLANTHEVIPFAYDWRAPIEASAAALARVVAQALEARTATGRPVRVLAHSMGGLVLRAMQWVDRPTWDKMMGAAEARLLMLGVPNQGSLAPATVLTGRDAFVNMLEGVDLKNGPREFFSVAASFPGLLQMLGSPDDMSQDWYNAATWEALLSIDQHAPDANADDDYSAPRPVMRKDWVAPTQSLLDLARAFQQKLAAQDLSRDQARICIVHGQARQTPVRAEQVNGRFEFQSVAEGDGRVSWRAGRIPGVNCGEWLVNAAHGELPSVEDAFNAYVDLLLDGKTSGLQPMPANAAPARGEATATAAGTMAASLPALERFGFGIARYPAGDDELIAAAVGAWPRAARPQVYRPDIEVEVLHADLRYVDEAIMVGHQEGTGLYSAEKFLDGVYKQRLSQANQLGVYPGALGTAKVFLPPRDPAGGAVKVRPQKALVVGLGHVGDLTPVNLRETVTAALLTYAHNETQACPQDAGPVELCIASLLIGTGASNFTTVDSVQAILGAVQDANLRLERARSRPSVRFARMLLVDYSENLAIDALHAARVFATEGSRNQKPGDGTGTRAALRVLPTLRSTGPAFRSSRPRADAGGWPQFINIARNEVGEFAFGLTTDRARSTVFKQPTQLGLVERLVSDGESSTQRNDTIGQLLFELAVPYEIKDIASEKRPLVLDVDPGAAALPWEMLARAVDGQTQYLALQSPVVRKLRLDNFRPQPRDARGERALIIGGPLAPSLPRLPGAIQEAQCVAATLKRALPERDVELLLEKPMLDILAQVINGEWRIMHFAGHGEYRPLSSQGGQFDGLPALSGMVLSEGIMLSPIEIGQMRTVPELVFVNCCHLGKIEAQDGRDGVTPPFQDSRTLTRNRGKFAANLAEQWIRNGVRCVVAAAWAVDDDAAREFAESFYKALMGGATFGKAVMAARIAAYQRKSDSNTWAAYQCYGDMEWRYRDRAITAPAQVSHAPEIVAASELVDELENIWVRADGLDSMSASYLALVDRLDSLSIQHGVTWGDAGAVAAGFGRAYAVLGKRSEAIEWYRKSIMSGDGQAPCEAVQQWLNHRVRIAQSGPRPVSDIEAAIKDLNTLLRLAPTSESYALLGSAYKRLTRALPSIRANVTARRRALVDMRAAYQAAHDTTLPTRLHERFYTTMNLLGATIADQLAQTRLKGDARDDVKFGLARQDVTLALHQAPDFWSHVAEIDVDLYQSIHAGRLPQDHETLAQRYRTLSERAGNKNDWSSVVDQLGWLLEALPGETGERTVLADTGAALAELRRVAGNVRR